METIVTISEDTRTDISLSGMEWENAYALSGISAGTAITIQNKTSDNVYVFVKASAPTSELNDGIMLPPKQTINIAASQSGCWLSGFGRINII